MRKPGHKRIIPKRAVCDAKGCRKHAKNLVQVLPRGKARTGPNECRSIARGYVWGGETAKGPSIGTEAYLCDEHTPTLPALRGS